MKCVWLSVKYSRKKQTIIICVNRVREHNSKNRKLPASPCMLPPSSPLSLLLPSSHSGQKIEDTHQALTGPKASDTPSAAGWQQAQEANHEVAPVNGWKWWHPQPTASDIHPAGPAPWQLQVQRRNLTRARELGGHWCGSAHCSWALPALGPISFSQDCFIQKLTMHQWKPLLIFNIF